MPLTRGSLEPRACEAPAGECGGKDQVSQAEAHLRLMDIRVRGRHGQDDIPEPTRKLAIRKLEHLPRYLRTITSIDVEVYQDGKAKGGKGHVAEVTVLTTGPSFRVKATSGDPLVSIDAAAERLERKVREFKRRRSGRPHHSSTKAKSADMVKRG